MSQSIDNQAIPTELTEKEFDEYVRPYLPIHLSSPKTKIPLWKIFNYILYVLYTGCQWKSLQKVIQKDGEGKAEIHYTNVFRKFNYWSAMGIFKKQFVGNLIILSSKGHLDLSQLNGDGTNVVAKKGGDKIGYSGHKHQKGSKSIVIVDKNGNPISAGDIYGVDKHDSTLLAQSLIDIEIQAINVKKGAFVNLDPAFDTKYNKKIIEGKALTPNIKANPRNSKTKKPVAPQPEEYKNRFVNERLFAWQDKFRRTIIRWEVKAKNFFSFFVLALTMINLRLIIRV